MIETVSSVDRLLGLLSRTMGDLDQTAAHFEDPLAFCRKAGYRPELGMRPLMERVLSRREILKA